MIAGAAQLAIPREWLVKSGPRLSWRNKTALGKAFSVPELALNAMAAPAIFASGAVGLGNAAISGTDPILVAMYTKNVTEAAVETIIRGGGHVYTNATESAKEMFHTTTRGADRFFNATTAGAEKMFDLTSDTVNQTVTLIGGTRDVLAAAFGDVWKTIDSHVYLLALLLVLTLISRTAQMAVHSRNNARRNNARRNNARRNSVTPGRTPGASVPATPGRTPGASAAVGKTPGASVPATPVKTPKANVSGTARGLSHDQTMNLFTRLTLEAADKKMRKDIRVLTTFPVRTILGFAFDACRTARLHPVVFAFFKKVLDMIFAVYMTRAQYEKYRTESNEFVELKKQIRNTGNTLGIMRNQKKINNRKQILNKRTSKTA
jgi:hypothetical protein